MPEKEIKGKNEAAKSNEEPFSRGEFFEFFRQRGCGKEKNRSEKYPVESRCGGGNIGELDKNSGKTYEKGAAEYL